jgi:hypothetical protein
LQATIPRSRRLAEPKIRRFARMGKRIAGGTTGGNPLMPD